ncbi:hypothetical protein [Aureimonas sp. SK2]|uniref:lysozyme inhibitor LprI family protein n=1 Tax=Aureimonas sp. SK2 TaxID=3015992 RepID=UPI00244400F7|nr:hypothetical protein [Aureimonas sp. SK2]
MSIHHALTAAIVALLSASIVPAAAATAAPRAKPSFDCRKASAWAEEAICADPVLARIDRQIAERFDRLMKGFPRGAARDALRTDQGAFLTARDWVDESVDGDPKEWLLGWMLQRAEFLKRVKTRQDGLVGTWGNAWGEVELRPREGGRYRLVGGVSEPFTGRWTCEIDQVSEPGGTVVAFAPEDEERVPIVPRREGGVLFLDGFSSDGENPSATFCGNLATVERAFFLVGPISDAEPEDW